MKNLNETILNGDSELSKEALNWGKLGETLQKVSTPLLAAGMLANVVREAVIPPGQQIIAAGDHYKILKRLKGNYAPEKHKMLTEVFGSIIHTSPHMARNYLIAKTLVDNQMGMMEQMSGSHPTGAQLNLPGLEAAAKAEKDIKFNQTRPGNIEASAAGIVMKAGMPDPNAKGPLDGIGFSKRAEDADEYMKFLEELL